MAQRRPSKDVLTQQRDQLNRCWHQYCDIDPLILRTRLLRRQGCWRLARGVDQEVLPII